MFKRIVTIAMTLFIGMTVTISCSDSATNTTADNPPSVPPEQSMAMDFSAFNNQLNTQGATSQAQSNFGEAVLRAQLLKVIVNINLAIPQALLKAAARSDAQLNKNEEWEWKYETSAEGNDYGVRLTAARDEAEDTSWNFYVTNSQFGLDNKLFFSGVTDARGTEGSWSYYSLLDPDGTEEKVSQITWTVDGKQDTHLRLKVVSDRNNNQGDYIDYTLEGTTKTVIYYDADKDQQTTLQWNTETKAGYVIAPDYNNGEKACWDVNLENIRCSK